MNKINFQLFIPFIICAVIFIFIKIPDLGVRLSDTNIYFLTGKELLSGKILYKDVFFTNFPVIPYVASLYYLLSGGNLLFYYFTAVLEVTVTSGFIYYLALKESSSKVIATTTLSLYIFSFMILATSSHQSGVFLAALFGVISYFFFTKKNYYLVGIFTALALLTKAYSLPLLASYLLVYILYDRKALIKFIVGGSITAGIILLPSLILSPYHLFQDVFAYSLTRSEGLSKTGIIYFLIQHDFIFVTLLFSSLFLFKRKPFFGFFATLSTLFFFLYKDVYFLYLNVTLPIVILSYPSVLKMLKERITLNRFMVPTVVVVFILYNFISYFNGYNRLQIIPIDQIVQTLKDNKSTSIYGVNGIAPALSYNSSIPLLNGVVDTNDNIFKKGYLNATSLTKDAIKKHSSIVTIGAWYPEAGIKEDLLTETIDKKLLHENCHLIKRFPFQSEGIINSINVFSC